MGFRARLQEKPPVRAHVPASSLAFLWERAEVSRSSPAADFLSGGASECPPRTRLRLAGRHPYPRPPASDLIWLSSRLPAP